jgi:2-phospho-L-lactate guanylyltransferase
MDPDMGESGWAIILPVKPLAAAKTRLRCALPGVRHDRLMLAFTRDTVAAVLGCALVRDALVVTDDETVAAAAAEQGASTVPDVPGAGLNAALRYGAARASGRGFALAALAADLPALRPGELADALGRAAGRRSFVPDRPGTGTVLLAAPPGVPLDPRFGPGSAAAHAASGAVPLAGHWPSLCRDVDTPADLAAAAALGVGRYTAEVLHAAGPAGTTLGAMQGTVARYDADSRTGTLLLDDGTEVQFDEAAFDASGLRLLRLGQRLRVERDEAGRIVRVTVPTLP